MIALKSDNSVWFDVDDTLVMWNPSKEDLEKYGVDFNCPGSTIVRPDGTIDVGPGWTERLLPHFEHIEQMKKHKARGHVIIVWSAGGWDWAKSVVETLGLQQFVDLVISKPQWIYDDLNPEQFMPKRQYMENKFPEEKKDE